VETQDCPRCVNGYTKWERDNGRCYRCEGTGRVILTPAEQAEFLRKKKRNAGICARRDCWLPVAKKRKRCPTCLEIDRERMKATRARHGALTRNHSQYA
jgi:hypothetical protein